MPTSKAVEVARKGGKIDHAAVVNRGIRHRSTGMVTAEAALVDIEPFWRDAVVQTAQQPGLGLWLRAYERRERGVQEAQLGRVESRNCDALAGGRTLSGY